MPVPPRHRPLLAVIAAVAVVWFLKTSKPVTMPLTFGIFLTILLDPVRDWLARQVPSPAAVGLTFLLALAGLGLFGAAVYFAGEQAVEGFRELNAGEGMLRTAIEDGLNQAGIDSGSIGERVVPTVVGNVWSVAGYLVLIYALFVLALAEVPAWARKLQDRFDDPVSAKAVESAARVARQTQRFVAVQAFTSVLTGALTGLFCWLVGLDLAFAWGLLAGVLNFIPTLGSIVSVVPPTVYALLQFGMGWQAPVVLVGLGVIQLVLGAWLDPKLQGRYLALSALVVLVSITFWGWMWGIAGAFIAVPLTAAVVVAFGEFDQTEWLARLLTREDSPDPA